MYIFLKEGFFSIVQHNEKANHLLVRCHKPEHMRAVFPTATMYTIDSADYRYRADINKAEVAAIIMSQIMQINSGHFKRELGTDDYAEAILDVWYRMQIFGQCYRTDSEIDEQSDEKPSQSEDDSTEQTDGEG